jgi:hypothetical protein
LDSAGAPYNFSTGWTGTVKVCLAATPTTVILSKTAGITLAATSPNFTFEFTAADMATIAPTTITNAGGVRYVAHVYARRTSDSKDMVFRPGNPITLRVLPAPA